MGKVLSLVLLVGLVGTAQADTSKRPYPVLARIQHADQLVQTGELSRAKSILIQLHRTTSGETRTSIATRIGAINNTLQLPSTDGLVTAMTVVAPAPASSLNQQAREALDNNDFALAQSLAQRSATSGGGQDAKTLYADALLKQGQYKRAKDFYIALYNRSTGSARYVLIQRIAMANRALRLRDHDGLPASDPLLDIE